MKLCGITLANFKSFADETDISLGQITCLIGPNGAGKSNVLYGLEKISAALSKDDHWPDKADYFNDDDSAEMRLGVTLELSDDEQQNVLDRPKTKFVAYSHGDLVGRSLFKLVKYVASFRNGPKEKQEEVWLSDPKGTLHLFARARTKDNKCDIEHRNIEAVNLRNPVFPPLGRRSQYGHPSTAELFSMIDHSVYLAALGVLGQMRIIPADRAMPPKVPAHQSDGLTLDGQNFPNELNSLRKAEQIEFDTFMSSVTHGDPLGIETRPVASDLMLEASEKGLTRNTPHTDLGTGQIQTLILGLQMFRGNGAVFVVKEPELHLHAERQKQMLRLIKNKSLKSGAQFIIETHSPTFLGANPSERVILVTKDEGRSSVTEIDPGNVGLICRELGITHADALSPTSILFVEGPSDIAAFGPFLKVVAPGHALSTMIYSLDGAHNTMNLRMLIKYLEAEGRRLFAILDENGEARRQVEELEGARLLDGNFHFLAKNLEDEFDSGLVAEAARNMAAEAGVDLALTAGELDASRARGNDTATALKNAWDTDKCGPLSKVKLAEHMVRLLGGKVPPGIEAALQAAVAHFEGGGAGGGS